MIGTLGNFSARVVLAYTLAAFIGEAAVWWSIPMGWTIGLVIAASPVLFGRLENEIHH